MIYFLVKNIERVVIYLFVKNETGGDLSPREDVRTGRVLMRTGRVLT